MKTIHSDSYKIFIQWLVDQRLLAGLTQEQLSEILKRPQSYVSKYETRERRLDIIETLEICRGIKIDPHKMLDILLEQNI